MNPYRVPLINETDPIHWPSLWGLIPDLVVLALTSGLFLFALVQESNRHPREPRMYAHQVCIPNIRVW